LRGKKGNIAHLRTFLHHRGGPGAPHEAISGFSGILSYFRFYFLGEIGWSLVLSDLGQIVQWCRHQIIRSRKRFPFCCRVVESSVPPVFRKRFRVSPRFSVSEYCKPCYSVRHFGPLTSLSWPLGDVVCLIIPPHSTSITICVNCFA